MYEILYTSTARVSLGPGAVGSLVDTCRRRNAESDITGFLLHLYDPDLAPGFFLQVLEGPPGAVEDTYARIQLDPRHTDVTTIHCRTTEGRAFRDWAMRLESVTAEQAFAVTGRAGWLPYLLKQSSFVRSLVTSFRTVTPVAP